MSRHFLPFYDFVDDYLERRPEFRDEHLALAWNANARGELLLGGALAEPADAGVLWFEGRVRPWTTVVGDAAATPVRPDD